jgi:nitrate reductase beta subunit
MTKSLSELITTNRPSLCAYCKNPAKGFLYREDDKYFGACSMEHLAKIKSGERLNKMAYLNEEGIADATIKSKEKYLALAKKNESYVIHEWTGEDRQKLFGEAIKNYLDWANEQAQTGNVGKITRDGT